MYIEPIIAAPEFKTASTPDAGQTRDAARPPRSPRRPWAALLNAVLGLAGEGELLRHAERPWASVTFSGTRHTIALRFAGPSAVAAGERFIAVLPEHEFTIRGQLVADATICAVSVELLPEPVMLVEAELLLLEES
jgi:hypothetical protein